MARMTQDRRMGIPLAERRHRNESIVAVATAISLKTFSLHFCSSVPYPIHIARMPGSAAERVRILTWRNWLMKSCHGVIVVSIASFFGLGSTVSAQDTKKTL